ncbi:MAG: hypothetical protein M3552_00730 [Planctomycetota bacterium]|nr:hypothetical protein [Planctomycetaceae bacterium]MDQ3329170.1 hypothetical protein [Planctomycetota bacterium]
MATATRHEPGLRPELDRLLDRLRSRIRSYVVLEGMAIFIALLAGLFWLTFLLDLAYFRLTNLELPVAVRATAVTLAVAVSVFAGLAYIALRLMRRLRARALALVLERRFPELNDRLILAVERAERAAGDPAGPLEEVMLSRTIDDVAAAADRIDVADVFDRKPLRRATLIAAALLAPILVLIVAQPRALATWWNAYGRLEESYHTRLTSLHMTVLAPPDDRPRSLEPGQVYKHPRGADLTVLLDVPEGERPDGTPWIVPESVYARRRTDSGARQTLPAIKAGDRRFRLTIEEVREGMDLWVTGGDSTNRSPYRIEVVDPPRVERVEIDNLYPAYTRLNERDRDGKAIPDRVVLAGPIATVPAGTLVQFRATSNKRIRNARIRLGQHELMIGEFDAEGGIGDVRKASLTLRGDNDDVSGERVALPEAFAAALISTDRRTLTVPLLLGDAPAEFLTAGPADRADLPKRPMIAVPLQTPIRVTFEDRDYVASLEPSRFDLRGTVDEPPEIKTALRGVSDMITRTAVVPIKGGIEDDHGIASVNFEYKLDDAEEWQSRPLSNAPTGLPKIFALQRDPETAVEWLDTATLGLKLGQTLTVAIAAADADNLTGPHVAQSDKYVFRIVTSEELLTALYNQEINLRKQFEQFLGEMREVRRDLVDHSARAASGGDGAAGEREWNAVRSSADRAFAETRQNASEVRSVESAFGGILEQLVNNRVHTEKQLDRIRVGILDPLHRLSDERFPKLDRAIGELSLQIADRRDPARGFTTSVAAADELIAEMEAALKEMQDLAEFHEAIQELSQILEDETNLLDKTKEEQKRSVIDSLGDLLE